MRGRGGLIFYAALLTLFGASEAPAQYWRPPPRYWREAPPPPPRAYMIARDGAYREIPPPPPRAYRPHYRCDRGSGGTIIGAIAGGLLGNRAAGHRDRGMGTVFGAGAGALIGREVDRGC